MRRPLIAVAAASLVLLLGGCAGGATVTPPPAASSPTTAGLSGELTIYAAASLHAAFDEITDRFGREHPGLTIVPVTYDGSSTLATQILEGASVDVFASADEANMAKVTGDALATGPEVFATNTLVIAVPDGNPAGVDDLADLADPDITVVLCAPEVPCGAASERLLRSEGVTVAPASVEQNVTAVLTKVASGEADAGLVYLTDAKGNADVESIVPDGAADVVNRYPIVALTGAPNRAAAEAFIAFVLGGAGQEVLAGLGFGSP